MAELSELSIPKCVVFIVAHADDIEFGCAGTIAQWTDGGCKVSYVIITDNGAGSNDPLTIKDELIMLRQQEQINAAKVLGVTDVRFLGYQDGVLEPSLKLRLELTRIIRELRPDVVVLMDPTTIITHDNSYINHPDHRAAGEAALYAVFPSAGTRPIFAELLAEGLEPHDVGLVYMTLTNHPTHFFDVSMVYDRKLDSLRCHQSQLNDEVIDMIRTWDGEAGKERGVQYVESFRVLNLTRTQDGSEERSGEHPQGNPDLQ
jgi:LmbE family N-acetylglucosaminyl deacetylase